MRMANGVLMEWISGHPDDFSVQEALTRYDEPDAAAMVLGGASSSCLKLNCGAVDVSCFGGQIYWLTRSFMPLRWQ
jgi:hypothetical protein